MKTTARRARDTSAPLFTHSERSAPGAVHQSVPIEVLNRQSRRAAKRKEDERVVEEYRQAKDIKAGKLPRLERGQ